MSEIKNDQTESRTSAFQKIKGLIYGSNFATTLLLILLIAGSYAIGYMSSELKTAKSGNIGGTQANSSPKALANLPKTLKNKFKINERQLNKCVETAEIADMVSSDVTSGTRAGVQGTPGVFVVNLQTGDAVQLLGAVPFETPQTQTQAMIDAGQLTEDQVPQASIKAAVEAVKSGNFQAKYVGDLELPKSDDHIRGNKDAKIVLIEYSDYDCPYCARFHESTKEMLKSYGDEVSLVFRHFPLDQLHPEARGKAKISECVNRLAGPEKFWELTDYLFSSAQ